MAAIFLSYRRMDSPQACRIYDWLARRFGEDDVFMDVAAIPVAVSYIDVIRQAIVESRVMLVLIGARWLEDSRPKTTRCASRWRRRFQPRCRSCRC